MTDETAKRNRGILWYVLLGLSPVGAPFAIVILGVTGVCSVSWQWPTVHCYLPGIYDYVDLVQNLFWASCILGGLCLFWAVAAVVVWLMVVIRSSQAMYRIVKA